MLFENLRIGGHVLYEDKVYRVRAIDEDKEEVYVDGLEEPLQQFSEVPLSHDILISAGFTPESANSLYIKNVRLDVQSNEKIVLEDNGFSLTLYIRFNGYSEYIRMYVESFNQIENIVRAVLNYELMPADKFSRLGENFDNLKLPL